MASRYTLVLGGLLAWHILQVSPAWSREPVPRDSTGASAGHVYLVVGVNAAALHDPVATVRGGVMARDFARIAHRSLHARIMAEYDASDHHTVTSSIRPAFTGGPGGLVSARNGLSLEAAVLYSLRTRPRGRSRHRIAPYAGITTGIYRRVIEQRVFAETRRAARSSEGTAGVIPAERLGPRARPMAGALMGLHVPLPAGKGPFHAGMAVVEVRYRYLFGDRDLPGAIRQAHQFAILISLAWKL